jgi:co-chaperonin GroES (HSP10)
MSKKEATTAKRSKLGGYPLGKTLIISLNKRVKKSKSGLILEASSISQGLDKDGVLMEDQIILALGRDITDEVKVGDKVRVNFARYVKKKSQGEMQRYEEVLELNTIDLDGQTFGVISIADIMWVFD